jgi:hypothetical protein
MTERYLIVAEPDGEVSVSEDLASADVRQRHQLEELLSIGRYRAARWPGLASKGWIDERGVVTEAGEQALGGGSADLEPGEPADQG